ncbi:MAG: hypothetical protein IJW93_00180 [Clostridia bacterium]|nr:hypothetical protein [Clostridia bacterium]
MKHTRKILVALILVFTMVVGITAITASAAEAEETRTVYLNPGAEYSKDNAWFAIWSWVEGQDGAWYVATDKESDGIYEIELPVANDGLKVLRMDPAVNTPDWSTGKWNESGNITIPEDKDLLTLSGWTPDAEWSTYTYVAPTFTVAGDGALCGDTTPDDTTSGWESSNTANDMTLGEDGIYTKSFTGIAAGTYEFKVLRNHSWDKAWPAANYNLTVEADNSTVTVSFNPATAEVIATAVVPQPEAPAPVKPIVNISDLTIETTTDAELVEGTGITASAGLTVDGSNKSIDGFEFTKRLKLGGTMKYEDEVVKAGVKIVVDGPSKVIVYGMASSSSATGRTLHLATVADGKLVSVEGSDSGEVSGAAIAKYEFAISAAGTYYLGSTNSGINLYYIAVEEAKAPAHVNTLAVGDTNKIVIGDTAVDNGYGYLVESVLFTVTEKAHYEFAGEGLTILVYDSSMNNLCGFTGKADLEAGTYIICIAANTQNTKGEFNVAVTKSEIKEPEAPAPVKPIVNISDLTIETTTDAELVEGTGISASAGLTVDENGKKIDGFEFTKRLKLGGTMKLDGEVVKAGIKIVVDGPSKVIVYGMASSSSATGRTLHLATIVDGKLVSVEGSDSGEVGGAAIAKYEFAISEAGTYYLGSTDSGINLYYIAVEEAKAPAHVNTLAVGDTNKIVIGDTAVDNGYGYLVESVLFTVTEKAHYEFVGEGLTILVYDSSMNNLCGFTGKADLEAGTYIICIAANTQNTKGEFNVKVTKTEISEGGEEEEKLPALALGDNTVTIDGSQVNITGNAVAWYTFTPTEDGTYKFSCSDLTVYILSSKNMADGTAYIGADGVAELKADTKYYVLVGKDGVTGEFTVKVESGAAPVHVNTIVVGDNKYIISDALLKTEYEFLLIEITEAGIYKFTGGAPMTLFVFHDAYVGEALDATAPYTDNVDDITYEYVDHFYVKLAAPGYYWVGFRYDYVGELREFDINVALHSEHTFAEGKCTECGAADPNYVPPHEHKFVEGKCECGETDPNYVAPEQPKPEDPKPEELGFFQMILKAITDFFAKVGNFFSGIFGKIGGFFSGLFGGNK